MRRPSFLFWLLVLVVSARVAAVWDALPETMASHFDVSGRPDGWASREAFVLAVGGITLLVLLPLMWPGWLRRLPVSWINVPYKDYWWPDRWDEAVVILGKYLGHPRYLKRERARQARVLARLSRAPERNVRGYLSTGAQRKRSQNPRSAGVLVC